MTEKFYSAIIEEEKETFEITNKSLKAAARKVQVGAEKSFLLDYNDPPNRCSYLYKYANINTRLVAKYFRILLKKKKMKRILLDKKKIKVCCLGGGPGTDVVGIFKALAVIPSFHGKITKVSVLDIYDGWANMFDNVMTDLLDGKIKGIPATFVNQKKFKHSLIEVDLLGPLPQNVKEILSTADIVCMVRFVSDICTRYEDERSRQALKVLGGLIQYQALVLYIDSFNEKVFQLSEDISEVNGFETVIGPLHKKLFHQTKFENEVYGCFAQVTGKFSVVGWCKTMNPVSKKAFEENYSTSSFSYVKNENLVTGELPVDLTDSEKSYEYGVDLTGYESPIDLTDYEKSYELPVDLTGYEFPVDLTGYESPVDLTDYELPVDLTDYEKSYELPSNLIHTQCHECSQTKSNISSPCHRHTQTETNILSPCHMHTQTETNKRLPCHMHTQTETNTQVSSENEDLVALMEAISNLLNVTTLWKKKYALMNCCCYSSHVKKMCD